MRIQITDPQGLSSIQPDAMQRYLLANGWSELRRVDGELIVFGKRDSTDKRQMIWVPVTEHFSDFAPMMAKVVNSVASVEDISVMQVIDDIETIAVGDVIGLHALNPIDRYDHTLPLGEGINLLNNAKRLATAAAASAIERKAVHPRNPGSRVSEFVRNLKLAQTERGSYVIRLISPISPVVTETHQTLPGMPDPEPFSRQAVLELMRGLRALRNAALDNSSHGQFQFHSFIEAVGSGVSANLCEALLPNTPRTDGTIGSLEVSVTWSYVVNRTDNLPFESIRFEPSIMPYIRQAAEKFRATNPERVFLTGWVNILERDVPSGGPGIIRLYTRIDNRNRAVRIELSNDDYDRAISAHRQGSLVAVTGELIVEHNMYYRLRHATGLHIIDQEGLFGPDNEND